MVAGDDWSCHTSRTLTKGQGRECMRSEKQKKTYVGKGGEEARCIARVLGGGGGTVERARVEKTERNEPT